MYSRVAARPLVALLALTLVAATGSLSSAPASAGGGAVPLAAAAAAAPVDPIGGATGRQKARAQARPTAEPEVVSAEVRNDPRPRRIAGAPAITRGCVKTSTRVISHRRAGQSCGKGRKKISFTPVAARTVCLLPDGVVKLSRSAKACARAEGFQVHALGNHKNLYCVVPGRTVRWVPHPQTCRSGEKRHTMRNTPPEDITLDGGVVRENLAAGAVVGSLTAVDPDDGDAHRFRLVDGRGSSGNSLFALRGNRVVTRTAGLDHEAAQTHTIRVRTADARKRRFEKVLTIRVTDVNEVPRGLELTDTSVVENSPVGTAVGTLRAQDPDHGDTLTYTLVPGAADNSLFEVTGTRLQTAAVLDHEESATRTVRVRVTDRDGLSQTLTHELDVLDVEEAPTRLALSPRAVDEGARVGTRVGTLSAHDPDGDPVTYTLVAGAGDDDNALFSVDGDQLRTAVVLDHEASATRKVRVAATDPTGRRAVESWTISVTDLHEAPGAPAIDDDEVPENAADTVVGSLSAADEDADDTHTFSLVGGPGDDDNVLFRVAGAELRTKGGLDFEEKATRTVRVRVTDSGGLIAESRMTVRVLDVDEAPHRLAIDGDEVAENAADALVGTLSAVDPEGRALTWSLVPGQDAALFRLVGAQLRTDGALDHEEAATREVTLAVGDGVHTRTLAVRVTVLDRNDAPVGPTLDNARVEENRANETVGLLSATDQDGDTLTYSLATGTGDDDNDLFAVTGTTLRTRGALDFEESATRRVRIAVSDGSVTVERAVTVTVVDVNERPSLPTLSGSVLDENAAGAEVGDLAATDPDDDDLTFTLTSGTGDADNAEFEVVDGELRTRGGLDFEAGAIRSVRVRVSDGDLTAEKAFAVTVRDRNDAPTAITLSHTRLRQDAAVGDVVATITATDQDAHTAHVFSDASVPLAHSGAGHFTVDGNELTVARPLATLAPGTLTLRLHVEDPWHTPGQAQSLSQVVTLDLLEARRISLTPSTVAENAVAPALVGELAYLDGLHDSPVTFTLPAGEEDNADFRVDGAQLRTLRSFDHESTPRRTVMVQATGAGVSFRQELTVTVGDVNEAPGAPALDGTTVPENTAGATVGALSAVDPEGDDLTFALVAGTGSADNDDFVVVGGELRTARALDHETTPTRSVRLQVSDGELSTQRVFTITVADRNDAPTAITLSHTQVLASMPAGTAVGTLGVTDADAGGTRAYVFADGGNPGGHFSIDGDVLRTDSRLLSQVGRHTVEVEVTDTWAGSSQTFSGEVEVEVLADTTLTLTPTTLAIDENRTIGSTVADLSASGGRAPYAFTLVEGAQFALSSAGRLTATQVFDHEARDSYAVTVQVDDADDRRWVFTRTVTVADVNEAPSYTVTGTFVENDSESSVTVGLSDPEGDDVTFAWDASCGSGRTPQNHLVSSTRSGDDVTLKVRAPLDAETTSTVRLCFTLADGTNTVRADSEHGVADVNEPTTGISLSAVVVDRSAPVGTVVGRLSAVDPDARKPALAVASIPGTHSGAGYFSVDGEELVVARPLDSLSATELQVAVRAFDSWGPDRAEQSFTVVHTITLRDLLKVSWPVAGEVPENQPVGTSAGAITVTGGTAPYSVTLPSAADNAFFTLDGSTLRTAAVFDHESRRSYEVEIRVVDATGDIATFSRTVDVADVNEQPTAVTGAGNVAENSAVGTTALVLDTTDPDVVDSHTYTLVTGTGSTDNAGFTLVGNTLRTTAAFDHEVTPTKRVRVRSTDSGGLWVEQALTVDVTDVNEAPSVTSGSTATVREDAAVGATVASLTGTDPDAGDQLTWSVPTGGPFAVQGSSLVVAGALSHAQAPSVEATVTVTDRGGLTATKTVTVAVTPAPPSVTGERFDAIGNTALAPSVSLLANDTVRPGGGTLSIAVPQGQTRVSGTSTNGTYTIAPDGIFRYQPTAGRRSVTDTITYTVVSTTGLSATGSVTVTIGSRVIWYVRDGATGGTGTSALPFDDVTEVTASQDGDHFDVAPGSYGPLTLREGQRVFGPKVDLTDGDGGAVLRAANPGGVATLNASTSAPALTLAANSAADGIVLSASSAAAALRANGTGTGLVGAQALVEASSTAAAVVASGQQSGAILTVRAPVSGRGSLLSLNLAGTAVFTAPVTATATTNQVGVDLSGSGTVRFEGGLTIAADSHALRATGVTLAVGGSGNELSSTRHDALSLTNAMVATDGITLTKADAPNGGLRATSTTSGAQGRIVVTGATAAASGGTLKQVELSGGTGADLTRVAVVSDTSTSPVRATSLTGGLSLTDSSVSGGKEDAIRVTAPTGPTALSLLRTSVRDAGDSAVVVTTSSNAAVSVVDSTLTTSLSGGTGRDGLRVVTSSVAAPTVTVTGNTFSGHRGDQFQLAASGTGTPKAVVTGNTVTAQTGTTGQGFLVQGAGTGWTGGVRADIRNNEIRASRGTAIALSTSGPGRLDAAVTGNRVGATSCTGVGILLDAEGSSVLRASVAANHVASCAEAVSVVASSGTPDLDVTQTDNVFGAGGVEVLAGAGAVCTDLRGNTAGAIAVDAAANVWSYVDAQSRAAAIALQNLNNNAPATVTGAAGSTVARCEAPVLG